MPALSNLNDQQNLTLTQISYCSNMLAGHHGKTFMQIQSYLEEKVKKGIELSGEETDFLTLMRQFPEGKNPYMGYTVKGTANNSSSGFGAVAFTDSNGNTGISYRGTDGLPSKKSLNDWVDNVISGITGESEQCEEANAFFERYGDPNGDNYLFGHSKGGNLSEYVYVNHHEKIKGVHLLNPQPLNPWSLTPGQLKAMQSSKVDVVIVEGDCVWFIGMLPSYSNVRLVDSDGEDKHSYWSIDFQNGYVRPGKHPWWEFGVYGFVVRISPLIQGTGVVFGFVCNCVEGFVNFLDKGWDECKKFGVWIADKLEKMGKEFREIGNHIGDFFAEIYTKAKNWWNSNFNGGYQEATAHPQVKVNTYKMKEYASRLWSVNQRITSLDGRMDQLYWRVGLKDLWTLMQAESLTGFSGRLLKAMIYLNQTAADFEAVERDLTNGL